MIELAVTSNQNTTYWNYLESSEIFHNEVFQDVVTLYATNEELKSELF